MRTKDELNQLSAAIVDAAMEIHREFGPGLLERVYEAALAKELGLRGIGSRRQVAVPVVYKGEVLDEEAYRIDLLVDETIVVELKTVPHCSPFTKRNFTLHETFGEVPRSVDQFPRPSPQGRHQASRHQFSEITLSPISASSFASSAPPRFASTK